MIGSLRPTCRPQGAMLPPRSAEARCRSWTTLLTSTVTAKHGRQLGKRQMLKHVLRLERLDVEEPKRSCSLRHRFRRQLSPAAGTVDTHVSAPRQAGRVDDRLGLKSPVDFHVIARNHSSNLPPKSFLRPRKTLVPNGSCPIRCSRWRIELRSSDLETLPDRRRPSVRS
jgi:hypothetical protein